MQLNIYICIILYCIFLSILLNECTCKVLSKLNKGNKRNQSKSNISKRDRNSKVDSGESDRQAILPTKRTKLNVKAMESFNSITNSLNNIIKTNSVIPRYFIKLHTSSEFEALLLRMTLPIEKSIIKDDIDTLLRTINSFVRNLDMTSKSNPYRVTLHKIWNKLVEKNIFIKFKSILLLHIILKSSDPEDCVIFKKLIDKMSREKSIKTKSKYFDTKQIDNVIINSETVIYKKLLSNYYNYVINRSKAFTSSFEEIKLIRIGMTTEDIFAQLIKANKIINIGMECKLIVNSRKKVAPIVLMCLDYICNDLSLLFSIYQTKLDWLLSNYQNKDIFTDWDILEVNKTINYLITTYHENVKKLKLFYSDLNKVLKANGRKPVKPIKTNLVIPEYILDNVVNVEHNPNISTEIINEPIIENIQTNIHFNNKKIINKRKNSKRVKESATKIDKKRKKKKL